MIEVEQLVVRFGENTAVDHLNLMVPTGALYGLLGPNGAGKSTAISCIGGIRRPEGGRITVCGLDVAKEPEAVKAKLGVVPQKLALYSELSVLDNLRIFGALMGLSGARLKERVDWGLALARLEDRQKSRVETLSGGMQRRLNMACSLLHDPEVIICDEPTTGVDPQSRNHLFETIRALHAEGRTVVYTTHYMEEVEALCERVAVVDAGRVIAEDSLDVLLGDTTSLEFNVRLQTGSSAEALAEQLGGHAQVTACRRSLEDVFLELTGRGLRDSS